MNFDTDDFVRTSENKAQIGTAKVQLWWKKETSLICLLLVECLRVEQHPTCKERSSLLQPGAQSRVSDHHGALEGALHQEPV